MGSLAGFTDGPMRRPAAVQTRSLEESKRITSCNSYCVKAPAASTDTDTHGQRRRRRRRTPSVSSRHTTWLSIHVTRSDITARHHRNYRGSRNYKNTDIQVKVWQSFNSPSIALCNAPFNAPCSPVTPLLLVIAWYCTVLPCAPSCLQPQSPAHSATSYCCLHRGVRAGPGM